MKVLRLLLRELLETPIWTISSQALIYYLREGSTTIPLRGIESK